MDCRGISEDDFEYMMHWMMNEGNSALFDHLSKEGTDVRETPVEFMTYELMFSGGISYNEKAETSVNGLYAAGDEFYGGISCAATFGWIAGENAAKFAAGAPAPRAEKGKHEHIEGVISLLQGISVPERGGSRGRKRTSLCSKSCLTMLDLFDRRHCSRPAWGISRD